MENKKNRLTPIQKILLDTILNSKILDNVELPADISFKSINLDNFKIYNDVHTNIKNILITHKIEPHEIFNLIESYDGNHIIFDRLKKFIMIRNICILKRIYESEKWILNIKKIEETFQIKYTYPKKMDMMNTISGIIMDILIRDIRMFDITQCKIELDMKYNLKQLKISLEDQKQIVSNLLEK